MQVIKNNEKYIIGIDLGGMSAKGGLFSQNGELLFEKKVETNSIDGFERTLQKLDNLSKMLVVEYGTTMSFVKAIGVGVPGVVDSRRGVVLRWSNFGWDNGRSLKNYPN